MIVFTAFCLIAVLTIVPLHVFYWWVIRPALLGILHARLWRLQDEIALTARTLAADESNAHTVIERFAGHVDRLLLHLNEFDAIDVFCAVQADEALLNQIQADLDVSVQGQAPCTVVVNAVNIVMAVVLINSPLVIPVFTVIYTAAIWVPRAREQVARFRRAAMVAASGPMLAPA